MEPDEIEVFLILAEELHFTRTAKRLYLPQPRVSRLIASLERRIGGALFERTSRRVILTPLGKQLFDRLAPAYAEVRAALNEARDSARKIEGTLRLGCPISVGGPALSLLLDRFGTRHPSCAVTLHDQLLTDPYGPLRRGDVDVLFNWLVVDELDLTAGAAVEYRDRVLVIGLGHRLASRKSVSIEELADEETHGNDAGIPARMFDMFIPPFTPSGRPIRRTHPWRSTEDVIAHIAQGRIAHLSAVGVPMYQRSDLKVIPVPDLPPLPLGLIWCTARENAMIRALATIASEVGEAGAPLPL